tara:strand:- start:18 stop:548 length:531 start_codon:yes stop_codon:yes gene_type:complete
METHIGVGVGEYIQKEFENAKESIWIASPTLTLPQTKKILKLSENGIKIRIITSPRVTPETEECNILIQKSFQSKKKDNHSYQIEHKIVNNKEIPMMHVKLFIIDEKIAIIGSPNLGESHFWNYAEYIWILDQTDLVETAKNDYNKLWSSFSDAKIDLSDSTRKSKNFVRKIRRKF